MCGIAGVIDVQMRGSAAQPILESMCNALIHRGPDAFGYFSADMVGLGHRRLCIIDLASGQQPMANEDGTIWVTFNGEIYNFVELRDQLVACGHRFATNSDTEVIVHAYEQFGQECLQRFRGMFAFAIWDGPKRQLFLARDRVGKKPLFYTQTGGRFLFASELQALVQHRAVSRDIDLSAIDDYLTLGYVPGPATIYRHIYKLPPAHFLTIKVADSASANHALRAERYWQLKFQPKNILSERDAKDGLLEVLTEAIRLRLVADVPLGALLSGGIDSSLVVALMSKLVNRSVKTFSIGFENQQFNELPFAREVAERYGTEHSEMIVRASAVEVLPKLVRHYGEPFADSSAIPSYHVAKMTRSHVTVALNGDGGDESFGGYERYLGVIMAERLRQFSSRAVNSAARFTRWLVPSTTPRRSRLGKIARFFDGAALAKNEGYLRWIGFFSAQEKERLYLPDFRRHVSDHRAESWLASQFAERDEGEGTLDGLLAVDVNSYLPYDLLVKMDIAAMACSLEARSPFLDHKVMEYAAGLPTHLKIRGRTLKYLLKKAAEDMLPRSILKRRKMGFGVPVGEWMRGDLRPLLEDVLMSPSAKVLDYFDGRILRDMVDAHVQARQDCGSQLWALLWLEMWSQEFKA
jgi:asparagine synthase (glutamine-hydrolysing)